MKKVLLLLIIVMFCCNINADDKVKRPESYNYKRGIEAMQEDKTDEAIDFFNKDLAENPKNGYSLSWIAHLRLAQQDYGRALAAADHALRYLPKKDVEYVSFAYSSRGITYLNLQDTVKAINDFSAAIKINSDDERLYDKRAQIYYEQGKYDLSDADYRKMTELMPGGVMGYMGLGRNAKEQKQYDEAIKHFDYVTKLASDYSSAYSFRAEVLLEQKKWAEATDDLISALKCDWDGKAVYLLDGFEEPAFTMMTSKLKIQSLKSPNEAKWPYLAAMMYERKKEYGKAAENYLEANKRNASPVIVRRISLCYYNMGKYDEALDMIDTSLNMDSTDLESMTQRADLLYEVGKIERAIVEWDKIIADQPDYASGYYQRGWLKYLNRDYANAIEDFSMCIVLDPEESYAFVCRGDSYQKLGKKDLAEADFKKVIELEDEPGKYQCIHYAYQGLGLNDKAIEAIDSVIARNEDRTSSYYDAACLYGRIGNKQKSLEYIEKALELGYNHFPHIEIDPDMDLIRDTEKYRSLIEKYKVKSKEGNGNVAIGSFETSSGEGHVTEIPFTKNGGVCKVKCTINGLPLHFVFDTGASNVSLSMVEATFMMKNGYLSESDVIGNQRYLDANGNVSVGTTINLREVSFGGLDLTNVRASVVRNQNAPLLLGQSVLGRLGKIEIDNQKQVLVIRK